MGSDTAIITIGLLTGVADTSLLGILFIALIIVFFLLGFLLGLTISIRKHLSKDISTTANPPVNTNTAPRTNIGNGLSTNINTTQNVPVGNGQTTNFANSIHTGLTNNPNHANRNLMNNAYPLTNKPLVNPSANTSTTIINNTNPDTLGQTSDPFAKASIKRSRKHKSNKNWPYSANNFSRRNRF